jgi:hypothetical protein
MRRQLTPSVFVAIALLAVPSGISGGGPSGQTDAAFADSYANNGVTNVPATTQRVSCYAPELVYFDRLSPAQGYPDGGMSP